jgi:hypothetical protein
LVATQLDASLTAARAPSLCIGMATYDDFDGVWFTVQSICMYHPEVLDGLSFVVVDNHPDGSAAASLRALEGYVANYRYIPFAGFSGTSVRDRVFRESDADIVCCVDSHVLLAPGALAALRHWFAAHPGCADLVQGPIIWDDLRGGTTHMDPTWRDGMFGTWGTVPVLPGPAEDPFEVELHGLGMFACRREAWPGINARFRGFGGEEGYLHEKFRRQGGRVLCHPAVRWAHRFGRPAGPAYPNVWEDRIRNYILGWAELGWDLGPVRSHFQALLGARCTGIWHQAYEQAEHPLSAFDGVFCVSGRGPCMGHAHPASVGWRIERAAPGGSHHPELSRIGAWRSALREADRRGYRTALLLDAGATVDDPVAAGRLAGGVKAWQARVLGPGAVAIHHSAYARIVDDLGEGAAGATRLLAEFVDLDGYIEQLAGVSDRPTVAGGLESIEHAGGMTVRRIRTARVYELNGTGALVFNLCDGTRTVAQIANSLARLFDLDVPPVDEVSTCVRQLRDAGILDPPADIGAQDAVCSDRELAAVR